jgi:hypothetical protein
VLPSLVGSPKATLVSAATSSTVDRPFFTIVDPRRFFDGLYSVDGVSPLAENESSSSTRQDGA